jgi:hypothetical protein
MFSLFSMFSRRHSSTIDNKTSKFEVGRFDLGLFRSFCAESVRHLLRRIQTHGRGGHVTENLLSFPPNRYPGILERFDDVHVLHSVDPENLSLGEAKDRKVQALKEI